MEGHAYKHTSFFLGPSPMATIAKRRNKEFEFVTNKILFEL